MSDTTLKALAIVLKENIDALRSEFEQQINDVDKSYADDIKELLNVMVAGDKSQKELENTLVDLEIFAREQPESTLDALTEMTRDFDHEILQRLEVFADTLEANSLRIDKTSVEIDAVHADQKSYQEKLGRDINETFIVNRDAHKKDIENFMLGMMEELRQLSISHKTEIIGDLLTRLKGEPGDKGDQGDPDPGPTFKDAVWDENSIYRERDVLWKDGHSFIALTDLPAGEPGKSEDWAKYAMRGMRGRRGLQGDPGKRGKPGEDGVSEIRVQEIVRNLLAGAYGISE